MKGSCEKPEANILLNNERKGCFSQGTRTIKSVLLSLTGETIQGEKGIKIVEKEAKLHLQLAGLVYKTSILFKSVEMCL